MYIKSCRKKIILVLTPWSRVLTLGADSCSASQKNSGLLWSPKVHYLTQAATCPLPEPERIQSKPSRPRSINIINILSRTSQWSLPFRLSSENSFTYFSFPHACCPAHSSLNFYTSDKSWWRLEIIKLLIMQFTPVSCHCLHQS